MNIALWVLPVALGIFFVVHAYLLLRPPASLQSGMRDRLSHPSSRDPNVGFNAVLGVLAAVIAWGRFGPNPF